MLEKHLCKAETLPQSPLLQHDAYRFAPSAQGFFGRRGPLLGLLGDPDTFRGRVPANHRPLVIGEGIVADKKPAIVYRLSQAPVGSVQKGLPTAAPPPLWRLAQPFPTFLPRGGRPVRDALFAATILQSETGVISTSICIRAVPFRAQHVNITGYASVNPPSSVFPSSRLYFAQRTLRVRRALRAARYFHRRRTDYFDDITGSIQSGCPTNELFWPCCVGRRSCSRISKSGPVREWPCLTTGVY